MAEAPNLPFHSIDVLLGNDIAGSKVTPVISQFPLDSVELRQMEHEFPEAFPTCVTRAQARGGKEQEDIDRPLEDLSDCVLSRWTEGVEICDGSKEVERTQDDKNERVAEEAVKTSIRAEEIPITADSVGVKQREGPSLQHAWKMEKTAQEAKDVPTGYFVRGGVLFRKWRPPQRPAGEDWASYEQVVLPQFYRLEVMSLANDSVLGGHMGVQKTQEKNHSSFLLARNASGCEKVLSLSSCLPGSREAGDSPTCSTFATSDQLRKKTLLTS